MRQLACVVTFACLLVIVVADPAWAARDGCERSERGQRFRAAVRLVLAEGEVAGTAVAVCDRRTGRRMVVHRAAERFGDTVEGAAAAGRRVAWIERHRRSRPRIEVVVIELPSRRELRRVTVARGRFPGFRTIDVAMTSRGDLAWLVPAARRRDRIVLQRAGRPRREIARERYLCCLGVEDDRTLRWRRGFDGAFEYRDLRPPRVVAGCPRRERFHRVRSTAQVLVTSADYGAPTPIDGTTWSVIRACLRTAGRDVVVAQEKATSASWDTVREIRAAPPFVVLEREVGSRYTGCSLARLETVDLRSGRSGHSSPLSCDELPSPREPLAVTASGAPAWILDRAEHSRLLAIDAGRGLIELDSGPPGSLQHLRAEVDTVHWTHAGAPRTTKLQ